MNVSPTSILETVPCEDHLLYGVRGYHVVARHTGVLDGGPKLVARHVVVCVGQALGVSAHNLWSNQMNTEEN